MSGYRQVRSRTPKAAYQPRISLIKRTVLGLNLEAGTKALCINKYFTWNIQCDSVRAWLGLRSPFDSVMRSCFLF